MANINSGLEAKDYKIDNDELKEMLSIKAVAGKVDDTLNDSYFKVLYRRWEQSVAGVKPVSSRLERLDIVAKPMKEIVNKVYITPDLLPKKADDSATKQEKTKKRQSLTKFADSAKAELKAAIKNGNVDKLGFTSKGVYQKANQQVRDDLKTKVDPLDAFHTLLDKAYAIATSQAKQGNPRVSWAKDVADAFAERVRDLK